MDVMSRLQATISWLSAGLFLLGTVHAQNPPRAGNAAEARKGLILRLSDASCIARVSLPTERVR
jgi:hypothetical protein